eukprot:jgi/Botrbrau1/13588/Bobra.0307s0007.1
MVQRIHEDAKLITILWPISSINKMYTLCRHMHVVYLVATVHRSVDRLQDRKGKKIITATGPHTWATHRAEIENGNFSCS